MFRFTTLTPACVKQAGSRQAVEQPANRNAALACVQSAQSALMAALVRMASRGHFTYIYIYIFTMASFSSVDSRKLYLYVKPIPLLVPMVWCFGTISSVFSFC